MASSAAILTPFFFGKRCRQLFGVYHPAAIRRGGPARAAVLCYPWGPEYTQTHRSVRLLADLLAAAGVHVLRFDYFGTGDSGGELMDGTLDGWRDDVLTAAAELQDITGIAAVTVIGLRFGAIVAALAANRRPSDFDRFVLWDPVMDAAPHFDEFQEFAAQHMYLKLLPTPLEGAAGVEEVFGFPIDDGLRRDCAGLDLARLVDGLTMTGDLVVSSDPAVFKACLARFSPVRLRGAINVPARACWRLDDHFVPATVLSAIVKIVGAPP